MVLPSPRRSSLRPAARRTAFLLPLLGAAALGLPAHAETGVDVSCQAINATSVIGGPLPTSNCAPVATGQRFEIDFSNIFDDNMGMLPVDKFYSLQIANLNTGAANTLAFANVEFLVSGTSTTGTFTDQAITVWSQSAPPQPPSTFILAQGLGGYSTGGTTGTFNMMPVASQATFLLTGPVTPSALGSAAVISTFPINLFAANITSFTGARIRGTFNGSTNAVTAFSAGLAQFDSFPTNTAPTVIYGNAFNVPAVPGPLPLLGAGAAFGWSRRLRRRAAARV